MAITTPPFRTSLLTANGVPFATDNGDIQTTRDWWMYWNQLTDKSNSNSKLTGEGSHADRPMPDGMPDGALYYESDRGVIYCNANPAGTPVWQYVAGTMWGSLVPDQRPADLGTHDAGFTFRTIVAPAQEFIWSQTAWVETTPVTGAINLTHPNVVTKVGSTIGQIVEGGITDESAANSDHLHITAAGNVGIANPAAVLPFGATPNPQLIVGNIANTAPAMITLAANTSTASGPIGLFSFANYNLAATDKRVASIHASVDTTPNSGLLQFFTWNAGAVAERMRIMSNGGIMLISLPSVNPGAGTRQLWYDPADGNRVKFAP